MCSLLGYLTPIIHWGQQRFRIGEAVLEYDRPRPPCKHVQDLTEPDMTRALRRGICARVVEGGRIRARDEIAAL